MPSLVVNFSKSLGLETFELILTIEYPANLCDDLTSKFLSSGFSLINLFKVSLDIFSSNFTAILVVEILNFAIPSGLLK